MIPTLIHFPNAVRASENVSGLPSSNNKKSYETELSAKTYSALLTKQIRDGQGRERAFYTRTLYSELVRRSNPSMPYSINLESFDSLVNRVEAKTDNYRKVQEFFTKGKWTSPEMKKMTEYIDIASSLTPLAGTAGAILDKYIGKLKEIALEETPDTRRLIEEQIKMLEQDKLIVNGRSTSDLFEEFYRFSNGHPSILDSLVKNQKDDLKNLIKARLDSNSSNGLSINSNLSELMELNKDPVGNAVANLESKLKFLNLNNQDIKKLISLIGTELSKIKENQNKNSAEQLEEIKNLNIKITQLTEGALRKKYNSSSLEVNETSLSSEERSLRWGNRSQYYNAIGAIFSATGDIFKLGFILAKQPENAMKADAVFSSVAKLYEAFHQSASLMKDAEHATGALKAALTAGSTAILISGWVGVAVAAYQLVQAQQKASFEDIMLKQMEKLQESIYNLHKDMLDQFDQLRLRLNHFEGNVYNYLNFLTEQLNFLTDSTQHMNRQMEYVKGLVEETNTLIERSVWDQIMGHIHTQNESIRAIKNSESAGKSGVDLTYSLMNFIQRSPENNQRIMDLVFGENNKSDDVFPFYGIKLLNHPQLDSGNLVGAVAKSMTNPSNISNQPIVQLRDWNWSLQTLESILKSSQNITKSQLIELKNQLSVMDRNINQLRKDVFLNKDEILKNIFSNLQSDQKIVFNYLSTKWNQAVLHTAKYFNSEKNYENPTVDYDPLLCGLPDTYKERQKNDEITKIIRASLNHTDRIRLFFSPKISLTSNNNTEPLTADKNSSGIRACLSAVPNKVKLNVSGIFEGGVFTYPSIPIQKKLDNSSKPQNDYEYVREIRIHGFCTAYYDSFLKIRLDNSTDFRDRFWNVPADYVYQFAINNSPPTINRPPYGVVYDENVKFYKADPIKEFLRWEFWGFDGPTRIERTKIKPEHPEMSDWACKGKYGARNIDREQTYITEGIKPMGMFGANPKGSGYLTLGLLDQKLNPNPTQYELVYPSKSKGQINDPKMTAALIMQRWNNLSRFLKTYLPVDKDDKINLDFMHPLAVNQQILKEWKTDMFKFGQLEYYPDLENINDADKSKYYNIVDPVLVQVFYIKATETFLRNVISEVSDPKLLPAEVRYSIYRSEFYARMIPVMFEFLNGQNPLIEKYLKQLNQEMVVSQSNLIRIAADMLQQKSWKVDLTKMDLSKAPQGNMTFESFLAQEFLKDSNNSLSMMHLIFTNGIKLTQSEVLRIIQLSENKLSNPDYSENYKRVQTLILKKETSIWNKLFN